MPIPVDPGHCIPFYAIPVNLGHSMLFHAKLCQSEQSVTIRAIRRPHRSDVSRISIGAPSPCCRTVTDLDPSGDGSGDRVLSTPMLQCYADFFKTRPPRIASNTLPVVGSGLVAPGFIHSRKGEIAEMKEMPAAAGWLVHSPISTHLICAGKISWPQWASLGVIFRLPSGTGSIVLPPTKKVWSRKASES